MLRADWSALVRVRTISSLLFTVFIFGFLPDVRPDFGSSETSPPIHTPSVSASQQLDAEVLRDARLYPPLKRDTDGESVVISEDARTTRTKRADENKSPSETRRVKTGDTILNIRGAVRDAIGDGGAAPPPAPRRASRLDAFVIRPAAAAHQPLMRTTTHQPNARVSSHNQATQTSKTKEVVVWAQAAARITCDLRNVTRLRWYKDNEQMEVGSKRNAGNDGGGVWLEGSTVVFGRATRADAGSWRCSGADYAGRTVSGAPTRLIIYDGVRSVYLAVDGRRLDAGNTWVPVRDSAALDVRCVAEGGVPQPVLVWRLKGSGSPEGGELDPRAYIRYQHRNNTNHAEGVIVSDVVVTTARELHNASLLCEAIQRTPDVTPDVINDTGEQSNSQENTKTFTAKLELHVTYPPSFVISRWPGFGVALTAGAAAALRCDVDANPPARPFWHADNKVQMPSSPTPAAGEDENLDASNAGSATLRWASLSEAHAGWYRCRASWMQTEYSSIGYYLNVLPGEEMAPADSVASDEDPPHQHVEVPIGGDVQLHCPTGTVGCWGRRVVGNASDEWTPAGSQHAHGVLSIKDALYQEGGEYRCVGARAPDTARLRELKRVTLKVTGGATATVLSATPVGGGGWRLECGACGRGVRVLWVVRGGAVPARLQPDLTQHCWRATLTTPYPDEVWCVASTASAGAVAVFPPRAPMPIPRTPAPLSPHSVRALHSLAPSLSSNHETRLYALCLLLTALCKLIVP